MLLNILLIFSGVGFLYLGAEILIKGATSLALRFKISPLAIGLTIVAFGTSLPELVVSLKSNLTGLGGLSLGNIIGSNIFNIALILGLSAIIYPLKAQIKLIRFDNPILILVSAILFYMFKDQTIGRWEGIILFLGGVTYTAATYIYDYFENKEEKKIAQKIKVALPKMTKNVWLDLTCIVTGVLGLVLGSNTFLKGAIKLAEQLGISDAIIGLTIAAAGTSLPELATSTVAAFKKQTDIAIGNVVGSNIFNILGIIGLTALVNPIATPNINIYDFYWMIGLAIVLLPTIITGKTITRLEGIGLVLSYIVFLFLRLK